jgi:hypothetical protein
MGNLVIAAAGPAGGDAALVLGVSLKADTTPQRVLVVMLGAGILLLMLVLVRRWFARTFFHGFLVAVGIFLSFDIVVFHWVFQLHRIRAGREADVIEPLLVALGIGFVTYGLRRDRAEQRGAQDDPRALTTPAIPSSSMQPWQAIQTPAAHTATPATAAAVHLFGVS